jgi:hypothetical protein
MSEVRLRLRDRSRQRPGGFLEITRLLAQAVPYQIARHAGFWNFEQG